MIIIDKTYFSVKDPNEVKYLYLIKNWNKLVLGSTKIQRLLLSI